MNRLILVALLLAAAVVCVAAPVTYFSYPTTTVIRDGARVLIWDNLSGSRNVTGSTLKQIFGGNNTIVTEAPVTANAVYGVISSPTTRPLKKQAAGTNQYSRVYEQRDQTGKIVLFTTANGTLVFGTPQPLTVRSVYPAPGATFVSYSSNNAVVLGLKGSVEPLSASVFYVQGVTAAVGNNGDGSWVLYTAGELVTRLVLAPSTTYTIKFIRGGVVQTDGETTSNCGVMTDINGVCTSTFTTSP